MSDYSFISRCGGDYASNITFTNDVCTNPSKYPMCYPSTGICTEGFTLFSCISGSSMCCPTGGSENTSFKLNCNNGICSVDISYQNRRLQCSSTNSLINCLNNPTDTYINGVRQVKSPVPWLIEPIEIYKTIRNITSPCGNQNDFRCLPYSNVYATNNSSDIGGQCPSGKYNFNSS